MASSPSGLSETACRALSRTLWKERLEPFGIEKVSQAACERALMRCAWRHPEHEVRRWLSKCFRKARREGIKNPQGFAVDLIKQEDVPSAITPGESRYRITQEEHNEKMRQWQSRKQELEGYEPPMSLYEIFELQKKDPSAAKAMCDQIKEECKRD